MDWTEMDQDDRAEAARLITQAMTDLGGESAIWRLVDAVGLLSDHHHTAIGRQCGTGRGYRIISVGNWPTQKVTAHRAPTGGRREGR